MKRLCLIALLLTSLGAAAAEPGDRGDDWFKKIDADHDGLISRAEADQGAPRLAQRFDQLDTNKDGDLSADELKAQANERRSQMRERGKEQFAKADSNGDGMLSKEEADKDMPRVAQHFAEIDTNGDGYITGDELRAHMQAMGREHGKRPPPQ